MADLSIRGREPVIRTPDQRLRVFVSSTLKELAAERTAAREAISTLHLAPVMFELGARPHPPRDLYRAYLEQSHIFIGIYGEQYGWVAPGMDVSGLEDEYRLAAGKPKLIYIKSPAPQRDARLEVLLNRIQDSDAVSYKRFSTARELQELIENDLALFLTERFEVGEIERRAAEEYVHNLPAPLTPLIGREKEIAAAQALLQRDDVRLLTFTGPGGTGKTRLSIEVARGLLDHVDGAYFVSLAAIADPNLVGSTLAQTLGIRELGVKTALESLKEHLREKRVLLVLDNFEQVVEAAPLVAELLESCLYLKVMATSRMPLRVRGEREFPVPPLALAAPDCNLAAEFVAQVPSATLFVQRAQDVKRDFVLTDENAPAIAEICARLDGLPLAIELAAAQAKLLSQQAMLARLERRLPLLTGGARNMPHRQQTMRNTIEWSYSLLDTHAAKLFRWLAVFLGGCSVEAAEAVCNADGAFGADLLLEMGGLVDENLLHCIEGLDGEPRFSMLQVIREYAMEQLAESGEVVVVNDRHAAFFLELAERAEPHLTSGRRGVWLARLGMELDNLRAVLRRSLDGQISPEIGLQLVSTFLWFWYLNGRIIEGRGWAEAILKLPGAMTGSVARGKVLYGAGALAWAQGDFTAARSWLDESVALLREQDDARDLALALALLAATEASQNDYATACTLYEQSIALAREAGDSWRVAFALSWLGDVVVLTGDLARARALHEESLELFQRLGDDWGRAMVLHALGVVLNYQSEYEAARPVFEESAALMRQAGDKYALARVLSGAADVAIHQGDQVRAQALLKEAVTLWNEMGNRAGLMLCLGAFARIAALQGQVERAARLFGAALDPLRTVGSLSAPADRGEYDRTVAAIRAQLGDVGWTAAYEQGRAMTLQEAVVYALEA